MIKQKLLHRKRTDSNYYYLLILEFRAIQHAISKQARRRSRRAREESKRCTIENVQQHTTYCTVYSVQQLCRTLYCITTSLLCVDSPLGVYYRRGILTLELYSREYTVDCSTAVYYHSTDELQSTHNSRESTIVQQYSQKTAQSSRSILTKSTGIIQSTAQYVQYTVRNSVQQ